MIEPEVRDAYLFLKALENLGEYPYAANVDSAWVAYCRNTGDRTLAASDLIGMAQSEGFGASPHGTNVFIKFDM